MKSLDKKQICNLVETFGHNSILEFYVFDFFAQHDSSDPDCKEVYNSIIAGEEYKKYFGVMVLGMLRRQYVGKKHDDFDIDSEKAILVNVANDSYDVIIKKFNALAKELNISDSLSLSNLFSYMLYTGSFSVTGCHKYKIEDRLVLPGHFSFDIFTGGGVCLNYSDMLTDILVDAGYGAATILNKMDDSVKVNYRPELKREVSKEKFHSRLGSFLLKPLSNKTGNHACTLINEDGKNPYIYDATNLTMFECLNNREAVCKIGSGTIKLKPYFSTFFALDDVNYDTIRKLCITNAFDSPYSRKDFIYAWEDGIEAFTESKELIGDFREDVYNEIKNIADSTQLLIKTKNKRIRKRDID